MKNASVLLVLAAVQILFILSPVQADAATISGRVTAADGVTGIAGVEVRAYASDSDFPALADDFTDSSGNYVITSQDLVAGDYKIRFWAGNTGYFSEWYNDKDDFSIADLVTVTDPAGTIPNIDALLDLSGSISGTVTSEGGTPIPGITVRVHGTTTGYFGDDITDSNGDYTVSGLPGPNHKVEFYDLDGDWATEWYNDKPNYLTATPVPVTVPNETLGIDAVLEASGKISGRVTDGVAGITGILVRVYDSNKNILGSDYTASNGNYLIDRLPSGNHKVEFYNEGLNYATEWYNDKEDFASANPVPVTAPGTTSGINAVLAEPQGISFPVRTPDGKVKMIYLE